MAMEIAGKADVELFSPSPSLSTLKMLISKLTSRGVRGPGDWRLMTLDVSRAFFYAAAERSLYIGLPQEDPEHNTGKVGTLLKAMCGTRDALQLWQREISGTLESLISCAATSSRTRTTAW